jgi:hypothetical protein
MKIQNRDLGSICCRSIPAVFILFATASALAQNVNNPSLLKEVLDSNRASREKISSFTMTYSWKTTQPVYNGPANELSGLISDRQDQGHATEVVDGAKRYIFLETSGARKDGSFAQSRKHEAVLNEKYFGICDVTTNVVSNCEQYDLPASGNIDLELRERIGTGFWFDIAKYGLGAGDEYLQDAVLQHPTAIRWAIEKTGAEGENLYKLTRFTPATPDPNQADTEYYIDGNAGHLIVQVKAFDRTGNIWLDIAVRPKEVSPGVWFPEKIREVRQGVVQEINVVSVVMHTAATPEQFSWKGMSIDLSAVQLSRRIKADGTSITSRFEDGELMARNY